MTNLTPHALTLVTPKDANFLSEGYLQTILDEIQLSADIIPLDQNNAVDLIIDNFPADQFDQIKQKLKELFQSQVIDWALQQTKYRLKKLLISDMDSTIIGQECIDEIAAMAGIKPKIAAITERAMRGEMVFDEALKERVGLLRGLEETALQSVIDNQIQLNSGARTLVQTMKDKGAFTALVSGGFTYFTDKIGAMCGFDANQANQLEIKDNALTGKVILPILGSKAKLDALKAYVTEQKITLEETMAVGDGANDLDMIKAAGLGVAFYAKPIVAAKAHAAINHTDLTSLLYFQGIKKSDFVEETA